MVERRGPSQYFDDEDLSAIGGYDLDSLLRFGFNILRGPILQAARFGVWSFHHGDERRYRGHPACFWEIYEGNSVTGAILQRLTERLDGGVVLRRGFFRTQPSSFAATRDQVLMGSACWPADVCRDLQRGAADYLDDQPSPTTAPVYRAPTNAQMARFALRLASGVLRMHAHRLLRRDVWAIGVVRRPIGSFADHPTLDDVEWFDDGGEYSHADPFGHADERGGWVLCERFGGRMPRGTIAALRLGSQGWHHFPRTVLELARHVSYPFVLEHAGAIYAVPETRADGEIALYRAEHFPDGWTKVASLVDGVAGVDPTVFRFAERWWLTFTDWHRDSTLRLFVYHAPDLLGPWEPHPANPVKTDIRSARPAGTPFMHDGALYRPAQDCSRSYGGSIVLNRIIRLTPEEFVEEPVATIAPQRPGRYPHGTHTLARMGEVTLVDGKRHAWRWSLRRGRRGRG